MALVFTQTDLDNAKAALVTGAMEVRIGDRIVKYRSHEDIMKLIGIIQAYLDGISTTSTPSLIQASYSKGAK